MISFQDGCPCPEGAYRCQGPPTMKPFSTFHKRQGFRCKRRDKIGRSLKPSSCEEKCKLDSNCCKFFVKKNRFCFICDPDAIPEDCRNKGRGCNRFTFYEKSSCQVSTTTTSVTTTAKTTNSPISTTLAKEWNEWNRWSECSELCNGGTRFRRRTCRNGEIGENGCETEDARQEVDCNTTQC